MKIVFLGTGGGRFSVITQLRSTAGFYLETEKTKFYVDPGPGAMVHAKMNKINLQKVNVLIVTHAHTDHCTDAAPVIEAMTEGALKKKGVLIASKSVVQGYNEGDVSIGPCLSQYHKSALEKVYIPQIGKEIEIGGNKLSFNPTHHDDPTTFGWVLETDNKRIGHTSDGSYYKGMEKYYKDLDLLIINCLFPRTKEGMKIPAKKKFHMNPFDAVKLLKLTRPKMAIIQSFGLGMLRANPWKEAEWIEKESKVKTMAVNDGEVIEL